MHGVLLLYDTNLEAQDETTPIFLLSRVSQEISL